MWMQTNNNPDGKLVGDCVVRAIATATQTSWEETFLGLAIESYLAKDMYDLKDTLCKEVDKIAKKPDFSNGDLDNVQKMISAIKNIGKIMEMDEEGLFDYDEKGHSGAMRRRDQMGRYSGDWRMDGDYQLRGARNSSWHDARSNMIEKINDMINTAGSLREKDVLRRCIADLKEM